jgi:hypothetical protein
VEVGSDLRFEKADPADAALRTTAEIDSVILGHRRDPDHRFLMKDRTLYFYKRGENVVGYGYIGREYFGPFALLEKADFPAVLGHAETQAHLSGAEAVGFETPGVNKIAIDYLMSRNYRIEGFITSILSEKPFGRFENYLLTSPPFFL